MGSASKGLTCTGLNALSLQAIKEQQGLIERQQAMIETMETRLAALEAR